VDLNSLPSLSAAREKLMGKLVLKKHRQQESLFLIEGVRLVEEAYASGLAVNWAVVTESAGERELSIIEKLVSRGVPVYRAREQILRKKLDTVTPQPLAAVCKLPALNLGSLSLPESSVVVVCDRASQPGNLGAVFRVAEASGADAALLGPGTVDPYNPKCVRGSMGALFRLPVVVCESEEELGAFLEGAGFTVFEARTGGEDIFAVGSFPKRTALLLGSEADGVSSALSSLARRRLSVPMTPKVESLNVAVAAGIILYEIARKTGRLK